MMKYLEENPNLVHGEYFRNKRRYHSLWKEITIALNSAGPLQKSTDKWKTVSKSSYISITLTLIFLTVVFSFQNKTDNQYKQRKKKGKNEKKGNYSFKVSHVLFF